MGPESHHASCKHGWDMEQHWIKIHSLTEFPFSPKLIRALLPLASCGGVREMTPRLPSWSGLQGQAPGL
jgi:hypothetical protein